MTHGSENHILSFFVYIIIIIILILMTDLTIRGFYEKYNGLSLYASIKSIESLKYLYKFQIPDSIKFTSHGPQNKLRFYLNS